MGFNISCNEMGNGEFWDLHSNHTPFWHRICYRNTPSLEISLSHIHAHTYIQCPSRVWVFLWIYTPSLWYENYHHHICRISYGNDCHICPILQVLFFRRIPNLSILIAVCCCLFGVGLLTLRNGLALDFGAILCLICSICYAIVIVTTKWVLNSGENALTIGVLQLGFTSLFSFGAMLIFEMPFRSAPLESWGIILYLAIFCTLIGFVLQAVAQEFTSPEHTGLIYTLESVFASLFGYVFLQEVLPVQGYVGVILVFTGVIIAVRYGQSTGKKGGN